MNFYVTIRSAIVVCYLSLGLLAGAGCGTVVDASRPDLLLDTTFPIAAAHPEATLAILVAPAVSAAQPTAVQAIFKAASTRFGNVVQISSETAGPTAASLVRIDRIDGKLLNGSTFTIAGSITPPGGTSAEISGEGVFQQSWDGYQYLNCGSATFYSVSPLIGLAFAPLFYLVPLGGCLAASSGQGFQALEDERKRKESNGALALAVTAFVGEAEKKMAPAPPAAASATPAF